MHSPLPPARTGVADYSAALLTAMRRIGSVQIEAQRADVRLYHLGNNGLHRAIYLRALDEPGVIVLHDAVLHHFLLGIFDCGTYLEEFRYNYGDWNIDLAMSLWERRAQSGGDERYFRYPMLRRVVERSRAVIVHNAAAARMVRDHVPEAKVVEIPHLLSPPTAAPPRNGPPRFGVFGHLRESKRVLTAIRAFLNVRGAIPGARLLVAGAFASRDLERAAAPYLSQPGILRAGHVGDAEFWRNAQETDVCINLRYPSAGETSGINMRFMGIGKPVIVSDSEEVSAIPESACLRVPPGMAEQETLEAFLIWMGDRPNDRREIGESARRHIATHHSPARVAEQYWRVLRECA